MAINALIAQGMRPIGADLPEVGNLLNQKRQMDTRNALLQQNMAMDQQRNDAYMRQVGVQEQAQQNNLAEGQRRQVMDWATNAVNSVRQNPALIPQFVAQGKQMGFLSPDVPDNVDMDAVERVALSLGIAPAPKAVPFDQTEKGQELAARFKFDSQIKAQESAAARELERMRQNAPPKPADGKVDFARADKLRDEYNAQSKDIMTIADNFATIQTVAQDTSAAGDLSLIFSYMKMLDPGSVVREQEFANAQNAGGVPDRVRAAYNKVLNGERLSANQRADFVNQAANVFKSKKDRHDATVKKRYTEQAKRWNLNPEDVISDVGSPDVGSGAPAVGAVVDGYRFKGGNPADQASWEPQ
jgi:hypothetical protein